MTKAWYALRSKPNKENFFWGQLLAHQIEVFYPCIRAKVVNPRARKIKPYFPGYLFIHVDLIDVTVSFINWLPGSRGLVVFDEQPAEVPDALINAIQRRLNQLNGSDNALQSGWKTGEEVVIQDGPFAGQEAIFDKCISGNERVRVLLTLLKGKQLPLELSGSKLEKKKQSI